MFFKNMNSASDYGLNCVMCCNLYDFFLWLGFFSLLEWLVLSPFLDG